MKSRVGMVCWALMGVVASSAVADECLVYLGTYTGPKSKGIYVSRLDRSKGELGAPELAAEWIRLVGAEYDQQFDVTPDAVRAVGELIRLCRTAVSEGLAVVHTWYL